MKRKANTNPFRSRKKYKGTLFKKPVPVGKGYRYAGAASGAALGAIMGNVTGAVAGAKLGHAFGKWRDLRNARAARRKQSTAKVLKTVHNDLTKHNIGSTQVGKGKYVKTFSRPVLQNSTNWVINGPLSTITASQGRQIIDYVDVIMHGNWLKSTVTSSRHERISLPEDLYNYDLYTGTANGPTSAAVKEFDRGRMYVKSVEVDYGFLSMSTVPQIVEVYWITPKFDIFVDLNAQLTKIMAFEGDGQASSTNSTTIANDTVTTGKASYDNWGFNPWSIKQFRQSYRCLQKTKFTINPGDQRHISCKFNYNRIFAKEEYSYSDYGRNREYVRSTTIIPMVIVRAGLVGISTALNAESSEVSYGQPKVGITSCQKIKLGLMPTQNRVPFSRVFKGIIENTAETQKEIDDEDNVVAPEKN